MATAARSCCAMRRSADSSPFKPVAAASPSDSPQRSSSVCKNGGGGASLRGWCAEKENEQRDAARTPKARSGGGGGKGFMAPTISAASKASPRKKVLGERNEQQHLVPSSPAELAHRPKGPPEGAVGTPRRLRLSFDGASAPLASSHGSFGGEEARMENPMCKNHHHAAEVAAASADAEPSQATAPYDPKTNYLSPRPRFLHYKPNPRIELYRHGGSGVRRLEDGFASESSEDTDTTATTEEELTEEEQEQAQPSSMPNDSLAAPFEAKAEATVPAEACVLPPEPAPGSPRACVLTPEPVATSPRARALTPEPSATSPRARALTPESSATSPLGRDLTPETAASSARARADKRSSLRFLLAPLALILFMAAAFVCVPPPPDSPVMSNTALSKVSEFMSVQELHPVELAAWLKQWSSSSLISTREQEFFGPHFAANLSAADADADHGVDFYYNFAETWPMPSEEPIGAGVSEQELNIQDVVSASDTELIAEVEMAKVCDVSREEEPIDSSEVEQEAVPARTSAIEDLVVEEELNVEMSEEVPGSNGVEMASVSQNLDIPTHPTGEPEQVDNLENSDTSLQQDVQIDESEGDHADGKEDQEAYHGLTSELGMLPGYLDKISKPTAVGVALAAVILSAALAFLYMRRKQAQVAMNTNVPAGQAQIVETQSGSGSSEGHLLAKGSQFQNPVAEETERFGGSGASMYSSSLSSGHGRRRKAKEEESLTLEPRSRRESTSSYGSFTTYEKIPAKKGNKKDEAMTPVRRSSRLSQVKSPEA